MTPREHDHRHPARHAPGAGQHPHHGRHHAAHNSGRRPWSKLRHSAVNFARRPTVRRLFWGAVAAFAVAVVGIASLWWRLSSGPIELDVATPWLKAAIEQNFGGKQTVSVG